MQDVHRRAADRRRLRLRRHRHPVSAGLKDLLPASDLVEGTLNNADRPPVNSRDGQRDALSPASRLPHFNEVDECAGLDGLLTYRVHKALGQPVENTLHDLRWGDWDRSGTVRLRVGLPDQRLGAAGPFHRRLGPCRSSERQPAMYFRLGGGTLKGISKPGEIVWSRIFVEDEPLKMDLGRAEVVELPQEETERRWNAHDRNGRSCTPSPTASAATR